MQLNPILLNLRILRGRIIMKRLSYVFCKHKALFNQYNLEWPDTGQTHLKLPDLLGQT